MQHFHGFRVDFPAQLKLHVNEEKWQSSGENLDLLFLNIQVAPQLPHLMYRKWQLSSRRG